MNKYIGFIFEHAISFTHSKLCFRVLIYFSFKVVICGGLNKILRILQSRLGYSGMIWLGPYHFLPYFSAINKSVTENLRNHRILPVDTCVAIAVVRLACSKNLMCGVMTKRAKKNAKQTISVPKSPYKYLAEK